MNELLTTKQAASLFGKSEKTIGRYVESFSKYFSDPAKQLDGSQRRFDADDLRVLSLIHLMKAQGKTYALIGRALESGERAEPPAPNQTLTTKSYGRELALETRVQTLESEIEQERALRHDLEGQVKQLEKQVDRLLDRLLGRD